MDDTEGPSLTADLTFTFIYLAGASIQSDAEARRHVTLSACCCREQADRNPLFHACGLQTALTLHKSSGKRQRPTHEH